MRQLELRIPPPAVAALVAAMMWGISSVTPALGLPGMTRMIVAIALAAIGFGIDVAGVISFWRARTTVNPMKPDASSSLVTGGIYKISRNPMDLGALCMLVAWAVYLSSVWAMIGPAAFVLYINRFQIAPEERVLEEKFGASFAAYRSAVPRWL